MKNSLKKRFDGLRDRSLIQITGSREILAEGCGEVRTFDENCIVFVAKRTICIEGEGLSMTNLENGAVIISGNFSAIKFEG